MARFFMVISVIGVFCFYANTSYSLQQGKIAEVKPSATTNQSLDVRCGTSKDPQKANCGKKPDGLKGKGWEANAKVRGGQIEKILTDASISIEKKADKIFNLYDTVGNFSAMNYEFCWMYKNGVISCTRYNDLVDKVMPLIVQPKTSSEEKKVEKKEPPEAITLTSMRVTWRTTGDDKDWNTQPVIDVFDRVGRHVGHIDCCSAARNNDKWENGRTETRNLNILIGGLKKEDLSNGRFSAGRNPVGNDDWDYEAIVEFFFSNGERFSHRCSGRNGCGASW